MIRDKRGKKIATCEEDYWELEQEDPNYMEFPDDGIPEPSFPNQTSDPNLVDMRDPDEL